jgi:cytochrome P450
MFRFDPSSKAFQDDPYPFYEHLREVDPFHQASFNNLVLTRHEHVSAALQHPSLIVPDIPARHAFREKVIQARGGSLEDLARLTREFLLYRNPPEHTARRELVVRALRSVPPASVKSWIREETDRAFEKIPVSGEFDFMEVIGDAIPSRVILRFLGRPSEESEALRPLLAGSFRMLDPFLSITELIELGKSFSALAVYLGPTPEKGRLPGGPNFLRGLLENGAQLGEEELTGLCALLYLAGEKTSTLALGHLTRHFLSEPGFSGLLREQPELRAEFCQEVLRMEPPVQLTVRVAVEPCEIDGFRIETGQYVTACLAAANRDPRVFSEPEIFRTDRCPRGILAFGDGIHRCLGSSVALIEMREVLEKLLFPEVRLVLGNARPVRRHSQVLRGYDSLPVRRV